MRLCAALALVLVALVGVTVKVTRRHPRPNATSTASALAEAEPALAPGPAPAPALPAHGESAGVGCLRGRLLFPPGVESNAHLEVVAETGSRRFVAPTDTDDRYEIHLPSGRYTLIASMDELVGVTPDVLARGDATIDVDIRLTAGAVIRGKVNDWEETTVSAAPTGRSEEAGVPDVSDGVLSIQGLIPGRRYDLTFTGPKVRTLKLAGVAAPSEGLNVQLQPRAVIQGAIGIPRGARCPIESVRLQAYGADTHEDEDDDERSVDVSAACTFTLSVPDQTAAVTVVATGTGWVLEQQVAIPPRGDPPPICLNPPCRSNPQEDLARLWLTLDGPEGFIAAEASEAGGSGHHDCSGPNGKCDISDLPAGETLMVSARGNGCRADPMKVTVVAGDNHLRIPCVPERRIEGVIMIPDYAHRDLVVVRCAGSPKERVIPTRVIQVTCLATATALEYQIGAQGIWRSIPIDRLANPAFVEIGL